MRAGKSNSHLGVSNLSLVGVFGGNLVCVAVKLVKLVGTVYISISRRNNPSQPWPLDVRTVRCCVNNSRSKQLPSHTLLSLPTTPFAPGCLSHPLPLKVVVATRIMAAINNNEILNNVLQELRGVRVPDRRHASRGGRAYPKEVRELVIQMILNGGIAAVKTQQINILRAQKKFPCLKTCKRWLRQHLTVGNVRPLRHTGNKPSEREIKREALFNLLSTEPSNLMHICMR